ncbi:acetyl-CoA C-acetyltransferase [Cryptosporangium aurantiacum]|uniref:Acetyl-CoA C-acetyltransferase n=1 Tax=Cryptosporangium aurantiacum TaxID=134849 RepID=A0A1M7TYM4_9ACTN|nr:acetyl-CoA C-acetyltransferase [Cryptosporangium aurantiacum]SHN75841.1 acetyl-CoA C-acetyltransferase [Cryptosporangium aurantiacum]
MPDVFLYDHVRTPRGRGKPTGALHEITPVQLAVQTLRAVRERNTLPADGVDEVVLGVVSGAGEQGPLLPRIAPIAAGFADQVPGLHVNRFCASGLEAVAIGAAKIAAGSCDAVIGGGVESMSRVPPGSDGGGPWGLDPALTADHPMVTQGVSADLLATLCGFTRKDLDSYGLASQQRAAQAWAEGRFDRSVIPVTDVLGLTVLERDEHLRPDTTLDGLDALAPAFTFFGEKLGQDAIALQRYPQLEKIEHLHTAGTSSGVVDGAAAVLIGNTEAGERLGLTPRAKIRSSVSLGSEPLLFLDAPPATCRRALARAGMAVHDVDLWEINEAFAAVPLLLMSELDLPHDRVNVNGGAIALGHPLGATGAMILGTLLDELERRDLGTGVVTLCAAGGMGIAMVIERV